MLLVGRADAWIDGRPHHLDRNKFIEPCQMPAMEGRWRDHTLHGAMEVAYGV